MTCREHQQHLPFDGASRTASLHASPMSEATSTETGHCFAEKRGMRCFRDGASPVEDGLLMGRTFDVSVC